MKLFHNYPNIEVVPLKSFSSNLSNFNFSFNRRLNLVEFLEIEQGKLFSSQQMALLLPFLNEIERIEKIEIAKELANNFQEIILNSSLTNYEKTQLLSLSSGTIAFADFVLNGGIETLYSILVEEGLQIEGENFRFRNCSINMREVWAGALVVP